MNSWSKTFLPLVIATSLVAFLFSRQVLARQGCCSWHGGVCGCDSSVGRQICCDGTYSPTCTCPVSVPVNIPAPIPTIKSAPTTPPSSTPSPSLIPKLSPTPNLSSSLSPSPKPSQSPEVKGVTNEREVKPLTDGEAIGILGFLGVLVGGLGLGIYKLLRKFIVKKKS